jgi:hypothetical protein
MLDDYQARDPCADVDADSGLLYLNQYIIYVTPSFSRYYIHIDCSLLQLASLVRH